MIAKYLNYFIADRIKDDFLESFRSNVTVSILSLIGLICLIMWIPVLFGYLLDVFPLTFVILLIAVILILYKITGRRIMATNVFLVGAFAANFYTIYYSGGIFSYNVKWFAILVVLALVVTNLHSAVFWIFSTLVACFYLYLSTDSGDFEQMRVLPMDYFLDNLFFILMIFATVSMFYFAQKRLHEQLSQKNAQLNQQNFTLQAQREELNTIAQKLKDSNSKLENYSHRTAHDLIQPVASIRNFARLAKKDIEHLKDTDKSQNYIDIILKSSNGLIDMCKEMLHEAKAQNTIRYRKELTDFNEVIEGVKIKLDNQIKKTHSVIQTDPLPSIEIVKTQIALIFQNLISNSIKYRRKGVAPQIHIGYTETNTFHQFVVSDNGIGIKAENLDKIFENFGKINNSQSGVGLGLAIVKNIVELNQGKIWATSNEGQGAKIYFTIAKC